MVAARMTMVAARTTMASSGVLFEGFDVGEISMSAYRPFVLDQRILTEEIDGVSSEVVTHSILPGFLKIEGR